MVDQHGMGLHMHLISRKQAKALGMKHYFTGKPCRRGGVWYRRASDSECVCEACRDALAEISRRYHKENRESEMERNRRYRKENREAVLEYRRRHCEENRKAIAERERRYYEANREAVLGRKRRHHKENRESEMERNRRYREKNPHIASAAGARRRAAKRQRILMDDCELTHLIAHEAYDLARERKERTGLDWHVDHMLPMQGETVSGFHHWSNLQVIPATLNLAKGNRAVYTEPFEWLKDA